MKKFLEELKGARNIEWILAAMAIVLLLLTYWNGNSSTGIVQTEQEQRLAAILTRIEGVGDVEVMISEEEQKGVLVVAEGANNLGVCLRLQYAIQTLLGTEAIRIEIVPYQK